MEIIMYLHTPKRTARIFAFLAVFAICILAASHVQARGGFSHDDKSGMSMSKTDSRYTMTNVAKAMKMQDDRMVMLKGSITKQVGHEKYEFKDATGMVIVEIDDDDWWGQNVTPKDMVVLYGEVDQDFGPFQKTVEIDVDKITKQ